LVPQAATHHIGIPRQRHESGSSVGSWQMISTTGSLRSQDSNIIVINEQHPPTNPFNINNNHHCNPSLHNNMCSNHQSANSGPSSMAVNASTETSTLIDEDCFTANDYFMRRERLTALRTLFYNCYSSTVGFNFKNGAESATLGSLLGNFAEKVGLTQRTSV
jgi:myotubularin-related protein 14